MWIFLTSLKEGKWMAHVNMLDLGKEGQREELIEKRKRPNQLLTK